MKDALGSVQSALVLGGSSDIGRAIVRALVADRTRKVILAARDPDALGAASDELRAAGAQVEAVAFDAAETAAHPALIDSVFDEHGDIDLVLVTFGVLGKQADLLEDPAAAADSVHVNFTGATAALLAVAHRMRRQGHGTIVVLSSVAGERARRSNFVYGSAKAGLDAFAQGLADELAPAGIDVIVVRPGMVRTKMTAGMEPVPLTTTPEAVAEDVVAAIRKGGSRTVWSPPALRYVMTALRLLPRPDLPPSRPLDVQQHADGHGPHDEGSLDAWIGADKARGVALVLARVDEVQVPEQAVEHDRRGGEHPAAHERRVDRVDAVAEQSGGRHERHHLVEERQRVVLEHRARHRALVVLADRLLAAFREPEEEGEHPGAEEKPLGRLHVHGDGASEHAQQEAARDRHHVEDHEVLEQRRSTRPSGRRSRRRSRPPRARPPHRSRCPRRRARPRSRSPPKPTARRSRSAGCA